MSIIFILFLIATIVIVSGAYVGINGRSSWRQADVYGHILGFMHFKNFSPYDRFLIGEKVIFDIPIYEWIIAQLSLCFHIDPLVITNIINYFFWIITTITGCFISNTYGKKYAEIIYIFLMSTSPLILHYYSVPLPDTMAIAFSLISLTIFISRGVSFSSLFLMLPFIIIATLIKSPVMYVFAIFYSLCILSEFLAEDNRSFISFLYDKRSYIVFLIILAITAITAELLRKYLLDDLTGIGFAQDPKWYFGDLTLRLSSLFWKAVYNRFRTAALFNFLLIYMVITFLALSVSHSKKLLIFTILSLSTFLIAWLTFSNTYRAHDYYEIPVTVIIFISFSVSLSFVIDYFIKKYPTLISLWKKFICLSIFFMLLLCLLSTQHYIWDRTRTSFLKSVENELRHEHQFLLALDKVSYNPTPGGKVSTKFKEIALADLNKNCTVAFPYKNILIDGQSMCSEKLKTMASSYLKDSRYTFIKLDEKLLELEILKNEPVN